MPSAAIPSAAPVRINYHVLFWMAVVLHIVYHALVFRFVNAIYLDSDQAFMWAGVSDYAKGIFREPRFYGQDYNTFFEALVAVPFRWLGMPVQYALPLATHICAFLPWAVPAGFLYRRREVSRATAFLAVPLCLLLPYDVMTGIPRGFVSGLTFTLLFAHSLHTPHSMRLIAANTVLAVIGFFVNPNSLLVSAPCLFYLWLCNVRNGRFYLVSSVAIPTAVACWLLFDRFYWQHPEYVVYGVNLEFSTGHLSENLAHLNERLAHVSFFSSTHAWFTAAAIVLLLAALLIHNRNGFFSALVVPAIIMITLASNKGGDGSLWPFYSFGRNYIGLPLFFCALHHASSRPQPACDRTGAGCPRHRCIQAGHIRKNDEELL